MDDQWFRDYVLLQFRIDKLIRKFTESRFVDYYYGPPEWKETVEAEGESPALDLVRAANALLDTLSAGRDKSGPYAFEDADSAMAAWKTRSSNTS